MITTALPFLEELSEILKETTTDTSPMRVGYFYRAVRKILSMYKFGWARKKFTLTIVPDATEYDLNFLISDYNPLWGVYKIYINNTEIFPVGYNARSNNPSKYQFYILDDNKGVGFTRAPSDEDVVDIKYYARIVKPATSSTTLNLSIPEDILNAGCLYMKHLVHEGKRQRFDSRNALLDFKEEIDTLRPQEASNKAQGMPKTIPNIFVTSNFRRRYP